MSTNEEIDALRKARAKPIAAAVARSEPKDWLVEAVMIGSESLRAANNVEKIRLSRKRARAVLQQVQRAADTLSKAYDPRGGLLLREDVLAHLNNVDPTGISQWLDVNQLQDISRRASEAYSRVPAGQGKARGSRAINPRTLCAAWIKELWTAVHSKAPGSGTAEALAAADAFWTSSGGPRLGRAGNFERWKQYFEHSEAAEARKSFPSDFEFIRYRIQQSSRPAVQIHTKEPDWDGQPEP